MKLARFKRGETLSWGVLTQNDVSDIKQNAPFLPASIVDFLQYKDELTPLLERCSKGVARYPLDEIELLSPVARPGKILAIARNYAKHAAEMGEAPPEGQRWFSKMATAINDPHGKVELPAVSDKLDYEAELVVVIGKYGRNVPVERAMEIVGGFTCGCDYSVRDWQKASPTMMMGKGFDSHAPIGPCIVTPDEIGDYRELRLRCLVDGEERQNGSAGDMIHDIASQIAHLSAAFTLEPGDLIFTGTPDGVAMAMDPPAWLKVGHRVRVEIDRIGVIESEIVAGRSECVIR